MKTVTEGHAPRTPSIQAAATESAKEWDTATANVVGLAVAPSGEGKKPEPLHRPGPSVRIRRRGRSVTQAGRAHANRWVLTFEPQSPPFIDPLMGWTGTADASRQVQLVFPGKEEAVQFAMRHGWASSVSEHNETQREVKTYAKLPVGHRVLGEKNRAAA